MDEVTQQNAALVEQAAAAAASLQDQTGRLRDTVSAFRVNGAAAVPRWRGQGDNVLRVLHAVPSRAVAEA
jgi:methyl-accepting chemotaxis protein